MALGMRRYPEALISGYANVVDGDTLEVNVLGFICGAEDKLAIHAQPHKDQTAVCAEL